MPAPSRRIFIYWLLLLVPALAAGFGALFLLRKEQARLDEQARGATALRREAIAARAQQIAENVELVVGDVETGLMATLSQANETNPDAFFTAWGQGNPLVRSTFRLAGDDRILRPAEEVKRRWLAEWIASGVPWRGAPPRPEKESPQTEFQRKDASVNVSNTQNARNSLQQAAQQGVFPNPAQKSQTPGSFVERTGWVPWRGADGLHLIGWRQPQFGGVLGVDVNLPEIVGRLGELLPRDGDMADAFEVREAGVTRQSKSYGGSLSSAAIFSRGGERTDDNLIRVPLSATVLPGWEVVGVVGDGTLGGSGSRFFLFGSLLVGIFIVAILAGGSLLVRQARRSEAEAAQKTSFVANVSHEFKTPLTTIRLYAELLEQGRVRDAAQGGDYLRTIARETQRLARLVNNALDFSRLEQGKKKFSLESLDLVAELTRLLETHGPRIAESGLTLRCELPPGPMTIATDRDALEQIVLNLLDNACKYAAEGGEVIVVLTAPRPGNGGAELHVLDRGPGVPVEHHERIFEKFHRVDDTLTAEKSGAGLGLSIARQLARGLGGELHYHPREGGGADFVLTLP